MGLRPRKGKICCAKRKKNVNTFFLYIINIWKSVCIKIKNINQFSRFLRNPNAEKQKPAAPVKTQRKSEKKNRGCPNSDIFALICYY